jgi:hypothetical protein
MLLHYAELSPKFWEEEESWNLSVLVVMMVLADSDTAVCSHVQ